MPDLQVDLYKSYGIRSMPTTRDLGYCELIATFSTSANHTLSPLFDAERWTAPSKTSSFHAASPSAGKDSSSVHGFDYTVSHAGEGCLITVSCRRFPKVLHHQRCWLRARYWLRADDTSPLNHGLRRNVHRRQS